MKKLKISDTEKEILEEELEWQLESFEKNYFEENNKKPSKKEIQKFIDDFYKENALPEKEKMRQSDKENAMFECILDQLKGRGNRNNSTELTIEDMSDILKKAGFERGSSTKSLYRWMIARLLEEGVKKEKRDNKIYYFLENTGYNSKQINDSYSNKLEQLTIISDFLDSIKDSPVYENAKSYIDDQLSGRYSDVASRVVFLGAPASDIKKEIWEKLYKSLSTNCFIVIEYLAEGRSVVEKYAVKPYQLIFDNGCWELWGDCTKPKHEGRKLFNLSRILSVEIREDSTHFKYLPEYDFRKTLKGNFGCYNDNEEMSYKLQFNKDSYAFLYSKDRIWAENQKIEETDDAYIMTFDACQYKPILRWVLGWGSDVIPLEPQKLVDDWKENIKSLQKYL